MISLSSSSLLLLESIPNVFDITSSFCLSSFTGPETSKFSFVTSFICFSTVSFAFLYSPTIFPIFFAASGKRFVPKSRISATKIIISHSLPIIFSKYSNTKLSRSLQN
uniref:Uncharacterized protein n=1 Tax=uncultured marine crenarchaeote HF4000_ANIW133O4 TaxID=455574 RepID=B3T4F4_9ARCH|nr:hypothetical protein ALOHA_HF4000ANIW133O4ctg2g42 [uncultured marine crenarchaeote HF4000_ANIW133O4]